MDYDGVERNPLQYHIRNRGRDVQWRSDNYDDSILSRPNPRNNTERSSCEEVIDAFLDAKIVMTRKFKNQW